MTTMTTHNSPAEARAPFAKAEDGNAGIEFALLAPFIVGIYLGLAELSLAMSVDRQVSHSASVAGDLATQAMQLDTDQIADIMSATMRVAGVRDAQNMTIELQSFSKDASGKITNLGTATYNDSGADKLPDFDVASLGNDLLSEDSGVVVARVRYPYKPLGLSSRKRRSDGKTWIDDEIDFVETFLLKPRRSTEIEIVGEDAVTTCTGPYTGVICSSSATTP